MVTNTREGAAVSGWSAADVADQAARTVLVTGASSGLGLQTAMVLAGRCATVATGALPQIYAATVVDVRGGEYFGPSILGQTRGAPGRVVASAAARNVHTVRRLRERTAELTSVSPDPA